MQQLTVDWLTLLSQLIYYFPWYVGLVLVPMIIRVVIEKAIGITPEAFESRTFSILPLDMSYESAFRTIALTVLYYPLFEELVFRGLPYFFFGLPGVVIGSFVWVVMHPAWQLQYLSSYPSKKKLLFTFTSSMYYTCNAVFYGMMWVDGAGLTAILYHIIHNGWLTLGDMIKEVELPTPWKRNKYVKQPLSEETPTTLKLFRLKKPSVKPVEEESREAGESEEELPLKFVIRKARKSLSDEVEEAKSFVFVAKKIKNKEGE